jgi:hypothetical protein
MYLHSLLSAIFVCPDQSHASELARAGGRFCLAHRWMEHSQYDSTSQSRVSKPSLYQWGALQDNDLQRRVMWDLRVIRSFHVADIVLQRTLVADARPIIPYTHFEVVFPAGWYPVRSYANICNSYTSLMLLSYRWAKSRLIRLVALFEYQSGSPVTQQRNQAERVSIRNAFVAQKQCRRVSNTMRPQHRSIKRSIVEIGDN